MALAPYKVTVIAKEDSPYNVIPNAPIEIRARLANGTSGGLSLIYSDSEGTSPITQTGATADANGEFVFYAEAAEYNAIYQAKVVPVDVGITPATLSTALINDLSQAYEFATVAEYKAFAAEFPVGKVIHLLDREAEFLVITGSTPTLDNDVIYSDKVSQSIEYVIKDATVNLAGLGFKTTTNGRETLRAGIALLQDGYTLKGIKDTVVTINADADITTIAINGIADLTVKNLNLSFPDTYNRNIFNISNCPRVMFRDNIIDASLIDVGLIGDSFADMISFDLSNEARVLNNNIVGAPVQSLNLRNCNKSLVQGNVIFDGGRKRIILLPSGISLGGGIIIYQSPDTIVDANIIERVWSLGIYIYSETTASPAARTIVSNNKIKDTQSNGIRFEPDDAGTASCYNNIAIGNVIINAGRTSIRCNGNESTITGNTLVDNGNNFYDPGNDPTNAHVETNYTNGLVVSGNSMHGAQTGFKLSPNIAGSQGCQNILVTGNVMSNMESNIYRSVINAAVVKNIVIQGNELSGSTTSGRHIYLQAIDDAIISDNVIHDTTGSGQFNDAILLENVPKVSIKDNIIDAKDHDYAVYVNNASSGSTTVDISGNTIKDMSRGFARIQNATYLTMVGNTVTNLNTSNAASQNGIWADNCVTVNMQNNIISTDAVAGFRGVRLDMTSATKQFGYIENNVFKCSTTVDNLTGVPLSTSLKATENINTFGL